MTTSKPLFVYLQRPDTSEWVTVGRYLGDPANRFGTFKYAPSYVDAGFTWSIDPVNLPFLPDHAFTAPRYGGLHDVLRDAGPDSWGQALLRREHNLPDATPSVRFLTLSNNAYRWGALAIGASKNPSIAAFGTPKLPQMERLVSELQAISAHLPAVDAALRAR
jgi:serine/threonine-protein kinase HipA